jgi:hypothetical protein
MDGRFFYLGGENMLRILAFILVAMGAIAVYGAKAVVSKYELDKKVKVEFENEMTEEEITNYKTQRAVLNIKIAGMLIALPGLIIVLVFFR